MGPTDDIDTIHTQIEAVRDPDSGGFGVSTLRSTAIRLDEAAELADRHPRATARLAPEVVALVAALAEDDADQAVDLFGGGYLVERCLTASLQVLTAVAPREALDALRDPETPATRADLWRVFDRFLPAPGPGRDAGALATACARYLGFTAELPSAERAVSLTTGYLAVTRAATTLPVLRSCVRGLTFLSRPAPTERIADSLRAVLPALAQVEDAQVLAWVVVIHERVGIESGTRPDLAAVCSRYTQTAVNEPEHAAALAALYTLVDGNHPNVLQRWPTVDPFGFATGVVHLLEDAPRAIGIEHASVLESTLRNATGAVTELVAAFARHRPRFLRFFLAPDLLEGDLLVAAVQPIATHCPDLLTDAAVDALTEAYAPDDGWNRASDVLEALIAVSDSRPELLTARHVDIAVRTMTEYDGPSARHLREVSATLLSRITTVRADLITSAEVEWAVETVAAGGDGRRQSPSMVATVDLLTAAVAQSPPRVSRSQVVAIAAALPEYPPAADDETASRLAALVGMASQNRPEIYTAALLAPLTREDGYLGTDTPGRVDALTALVDVAGVAPEALDSRIESVITALIRDESVATDTRIAAAEALTEVVSRIPRLTTQSLTENLCDVVTADGVPVAVRRVVLGTLTTIAHHSGTLLSADGIRTVIESLQTGRAEVRPAAFIGAVAASRPAELRDTDVDLLEGWLDDGGRLGTTAAPALTSVVTHCTSLVSPALIERLLERIVDDGNGRTAREIAAVIEHAAMATPDAFTSDSVSTITALCLSSPSVDGHVARSLIDEPFRRGTTVYRLALIRTLGALATADPTHIGDPQVVALAELLGDDRQLRGHRVADVAAETLVTVATHSPEAIRRLPTGLYGYLMRSLLSVISGRSESLTNPVLQVLRAIEVRASHADRVQTALRPLLQAPPDENTKLLAVSVYAAMQPPPSDLRFDVTRSVDRGE